MQFKKIHNKGQARLFNNRRLEYFTKAHPLVIWAIYLPVIVGMTWYGYHAHISLLKTALLFLGGIFFWTFFEYIMHRYVFHFMAESERGDKIIYLIHGNHHEYPRDRQRLFMPPLPSILFSSLLFSLMYCVAWMAGNTAAAFIFFPGFMLGYLLYGSMHYAIHAWNPPFKWMKPLWRNHHLHHYKEEEKGFGVSSTLWDHIFGTMFDLKREKEDKENVGSLMFQPRQSRENAS